MRSAFVRSCSIHQARSSNASLSNSKLLDDSLEVGYAWGRNVATILLAKDVGDLKFDVKGQRCIIYKSIKHLEECLGRELKAILGGQSIPSSVE